ncbi:MAG TPA: hypothetical protein VHX38_33685 [Pseudonocardiaceae bacterium]|jgi:hypothetical protein|nr:hypothetical protein [Pseudonocardiaceae bacterium]
MTGAQGFNAVGSDAMANFSADLDAAVARARRVAAESRETTAKFRRETRQLVERTKAGGVRPTSEADLTAEHLRRAATGFRADHGLPVEALPSGHELLVQSAPPVAAEPPPVTPSASRITGPGRRNPHPDDDDEDFSQERIMF